jgi:hypothetical protein
MNIIRIISFRKSDIYYEMYCNFCFWDACPKNNLLISNFIIQFNAPWELMWFIQTCELPSLIFYWYKIKHLIKAADLKYLLPVCISLQSTTAQLGILLLVYFVFMSIPMHPSFHHVHFNCYPVRLYPHNACYPNSMPVFTYTFHLQYQNIACYPIKYPALMSTYCLLSSRIHACS